MNGSDRGRLMSSTALTPADRSLFTHTQGAQYAAGMASCLRVIYSQREAPSEKKRQVFKNRAAEVATYVKAGGVDKIDAVDSLANAAERPSIGSLAQLHSSRPRVPHSQLSRTQRTRRDLDDCFSRSKTILRPSNPDWPFGLSSGRWHPASSGRR